MWEEQQGRRLLWTYTQISRWNFELSKLAFFKIFALLFKSLLLSFPFPWRSPGLWTIREQDHAWEVDQSGKVLPNTHEDLRVVYQRLYQKKMPGWGSMWLYSSLALNFWFSGLCSSSAELEVYSVGLCRCNRLESENHKIISMLIETMDSYGTQTL